VICMQTLRSRHRSRYEDSLRRMVVLSGLQVLYFTGVHSLLANLWNGIGAILTLHRVRPPRPDSFQPNRGIEVTPHFLEQLIGALRRQGLELVSLGEMHRRLLTGGQKRFVCLTFDDGYRDNLVWAYPILKREKVPFAVYVPTSFPDRRGHNRWLTLESAIAEKDNVHLELEDRTHHFVCRTTAEKYAAFEAICQVLNTSSTQSEEQLQAIVAKLASEAGIDLGAHSTSVYMSWQELARLAADPLVTIGAHTVKHLYLRRLKEDVARSEMAESAVRIEAVLGFRPAHLSYPFGGRDAAGPREFALAEELGFETAVTSRPGVLFPEHRQYLTALPRISIHCTLQRPRYLKVLTSGVPTALWNGLHRVDVA
jgi:peptidoglycan/xylan/chitin deacetylase (PgdA/CDA1 family)